MRSFGLSLRVGGASSGSRNDTGTISPSGPGSRPSRATVCSSCHTTFSQVERSFPVPVTTRLTQVSVSRTVLSSGRRGAAILARSGPPSVAVPVSSSSQDTPKRQRRSVRWVAQMRRPAPTKGKIRATQAIAWPFWISGTAPRKVAGAETRFQKIANAHATRSFDCDRIRIDSKVGPAGRGGKPDRQARRGLFRTTGVQLLSLRRLRALLQVRRADAAHVATLRIMVDVAGDAPGV